MGQSDGRQREPVEVVQLTHAVHERLPRRRRRRYPIAHDEWLSSVNPRAGRSTDAPCGNSPRGCARRSAASVRRSSSHAVNVCASTRHRRSTLIAGNWRLRIITRTVSGAKLKIRATSSTSSRRGNGSMVTAVVGLAGRETGGVRRSQVCGQRGVTPAAVRHPGGIKMFDRATAGNRWASTRTFSQN